MRSPVMVEMTGLCEQCGINDATMTRSYTNIEVYYICLDCDTYMEAHDMFLHHAPLEVQA